MSFLTFDRDRSEKPEKTPPSNRMDLIVHAVNTLQNVLGLEQTAKAARAEERYGKVASRDLFTSEWDNFHKQRAAQAIIDQVIPEHAETIQPAGSVSAPKETILDGEVTIDPFQFDAIAADKRADDIETEHQAVITYEYSKEIDDLDIESLMRQAAKSSVLAKESYERIAKITL